MEQSSKSSTPGSSYQLNSNQWKESNSCGLPIVTDAFHLSSDASLFSTSLPIFRKFSFTEPGPICGSIDGGVHNLNKLCPVEVRVPLEDVEFSKLGIFLPGDEDELYAVTEDDLDLNGLPTRVEDLDDDLFGSGGGIEIESDNQENHANGVLILSSSGSGVSGSTCGHYGYTNPIRTFSGEHPSGEHPSRTLFVRNINSHVEDSELKLLFEQYGAIRNLYTLCKHRGFVMISYHDIRDACHAMGSLQNRLLRGRHLDIHFSIPKNKPSEKDLNQGTLVVFNLDASVSKDKLLNIFGAYGEVKEIREAPHKQNLKFIEFHDVRAAEAALKALNRCEIAGKRIKLEPSRPGGARQSSIQQLSQVQEQEEVRAFRHQVGSPIVISPPGTWPYFGSPVENSHNPLHSYDQSSNFRSLSPVGSNQSSGSASLLLSRVSNPVKIAPIGNDTGRMDHLDQDHSSYPSTMFSLSPGPTSPFSDSRPSSDGTLSGSEFLWGSPTIQSNVINSSARSPSSNGHTLSLCGRGTSVRYTSQQCSFLGSHLHVGSAPSDFQQEGQFGFSSESQETSYLNSRVFGATNFRCDNGCRVRNKTGPVNLGGTFPCYFTQSSSPSSRMPWTSRNGSAYFGNSSFGCKGTTHYDGIVDRFRRNVSDVQLENRKQYQLDLEKIVNGEDNRTTLMIKNIPNKYTSKMLIAAIDETQEVIYDFIYLPVDFKNKCNVGYAFINIVSPSDIITFYKAFNGKKWEKFNSEKVASLAYARIQGLAALILNFQNSTLMNEDRRCRPIIFKSECQGAGDVDHFPPGNLNILVRQPDGSYTGDSLDSPKDDPDSQ